MTLFRRQVRATIGGLLVQELDIEFRIEKSLKKQPNTAEILIYNLSGETRDALQNEESWRNLDDNTIPARLEVGYDGELHTIFVGDLSTVLHRFVKPGWQTVVSAGDGEAGYRKGRAKVGYRPNISIETLGQDLARRLKAGAGNLTSALQKRQFDKIGQAFTDGFAASGQASDQLDKLLRGAGLEYSIQNGEIQAVPIGQGLGGSAILLNEDSGLVGAPEVDNEGKLRCRALLQPDISPGKLVKIDSLSARGVWVVDSAVYTGSNAVDSPDFYINITGKK